MIPVKLTIQGLYSYQEKQSIDFRKLTSANLFGIFGAVGSGKSSILEAITFAIYGKTDRLNLSGDNRNYNMMNLKSNDLLIEFEFETGKDQTAYQAVVKGRRNGKKFEEVKTLERTAYRKESGNWIPITTESLESAIGLSYDNFKRTIIIPQGQFQEFLQLGNKDRTQMMKELFNLGRFELFYKVTSLETRNNAQKQMLEGQLKQLGEIDPEQMIRLTEKLVEVKLEIDKLKEQIAGDQKKEAELKNLFELVRKRDENSVKLKALDEKAPEIQVLEKKITDYEYCLIHFKNLFDASDLSLKKIQQLDEKIKSETLNLKKSEDQILVADQTFSFVKMAYDQREKLKQQAEELEKLIRLTELKQLVILSEERIKNGNVFVEQSSSMIDSIRKDKEKLEILLKEEKLKLPDMVALSNAKSWHELNRNLLQQSVANISESQKFRKEIQIIEESISKIFDIKFFNSFSGEKNIGSGIEFLKQKMAELKIQIAGIDSEIQHFKVQQKLEEFAVKLKDGEACPICGSLHHPEILSAADVSEALSKTLARKSLVEKEINACDLHSLALTELYHSRNLNDQQLLAVLTKQKELDEKNKSHQAMFTWEKFRKEEDVLLAFKSAEALNKSVEELEKQLDLKAKKLDIEIGNKEKYLQNIEKIKTELTVSQTELLMLNGQIKLIDPASYSEKLKEEIRTEISTLLQEYSQLEKNFTQLSNQLVELRKSKDILSGSINANQTQLELESNSGTELKFRIEKALTDSEFENSENVKLILKQELNLAAEKQRVNNFRQEISVTRNQLDVLIQEIGERKYEAEIHQDLKLQLEKSNEQLSLLNKEFGVTEKTISDLKKTIASQATLRKTLDNLELRGENIKTMKSLFKASGFVNYISSVYLQNLCNAANDRFFQLTRQKLSLEITDDNSFQVRDYLNGGKVRNVKTLSGGQTFQAALSLALALADNIQKITESNQNFFFLDEGFGSLDKDSLSVVFETLKSLRRENRVVGVISHVEEMQQEIDTHLRIVNEEEKGSLILPSWLA